jgi:Holliday junction resolvase RusA-like endonuclease
MTTITITGLRPSSKKNGRRNFGHVSLPSKAYLKFHELVAEFLLPFAHLHLATPLKMNVLYEIKGKYHQDVDNALASIGDCLQDYGVIEDDDLLTDVHITKSSGHPDWKITIQLEEWKP